MVKSDREQGVRQNRSAIFGSRAGSFRYRRSRANEEEVGGTEEPGLTDSMPGLPHPSRHVCTIFHFATVIKSTQQHHPLFYTHSIMSKLCR